MFRNTLTSNHSCPIWDCENFTPLAPPPPPPIQMQLSFKWKAFFHSVVRFPETKSNCKHFETEYDLHSYLRDDLHSYFISEITDCKKLG